ncbi:MAG: hypothetical protein Q7R47_02680 [Candidatus Diapherotrites archaeon]|nr:hypothetical protein [Candidatus Diapherotrites archaeon]
MTTAIEERTRKNKALLETVRRIEKSDELADSVENVYRERQNRHLKKTDACA